jgi:hypothetical protein
MPNDAKLGMIVGVGLVIAIAVVFFRKDGLPGPFGPEQATATSAGSPGAPAPEVRRMLRSVKAKTAIRSDAAAEEGQKPAGSEAESEQP